MCFGKSRTLALRFSSQGVKYLIRFLKMVWCSRGFLFFWGGLLRDTEKKIKDFSHSYLYIPANYGKQKKKE